MGRHRGSGRDRHGSILRAGSRRDAIFLVGMNNQERFQQWLRDADVVNRELQARIDLVGKKKCASEISRLIGITDATARQHVENPSYYLGRLHSGPRHQARKWASYFSKLLRILNVPKDNPVVEIAHKYAERAGIDFDYIP